MIIINTPYINLPAGVSSHYRGLKAYFSSNVVYNQCVTLEYLKSRFGIEGLLLKAARFVAFVFDIVKFVLKLAMYRNVHVLLNPSFGPNAIKREMIFANIAKCMHARYSIFIHGWTKSYYEEVVNGQKKISNAFYDADSYFVLANQFVDRLHNLGVKGNVFVTTTKVPDSMIANFKLKKKEKVERILYLARVEKEKGVFETIETFKLIHKKYPKIKFDVVGSGSALEDAKVAAEELGDCITFYGALMGEDIVKAYERGDIYILLSYHEGMPTSVLEAMAFGLPIITRPVGGVVDFFECGKMGYMEDSLEPSVFAEKCNKLICDINSLNEISEYNNRYASTHFLASNVAAFLESKLR